MNKERKNQEKLEYLAQNMFNRGREKIEKDIRFKLKVTIESAAHNGWLHSGKFVEEAIKLHVERIESFLKLRLNIDREVFFKNQPIKTEKDINFFFKNLKQIAEAQKSVIFPEVLPLFGKNNAINHVIRTVEEKVNNILVNIKRDLTIEKEKQILLGEKEIEKKTPKPSKMQEFAVLLKPIESEKLRDILLRDFKHANFCLENELWKPCVVLCGGILEGIFKIEFGMEYKVLRNGRKFKMQLEDMINQAKKEGILPKETDKNLAHAVQAFRNFVHIKEEIKYNHSIDDTDAKISIQVVKKVFREIKKHLEDCIEKMKAFSPKLGFFIALKAKGSPMSISSAFSGPIRDKPKIFEELVNNGIFIPCAYDELKSSVEEKKLIEQRKEEISQLGIKIEEGYKLSEKGHKLLKRIMSLEQ